MRAFIVAALLMLAAASPALASRHPADQVRSSFVDEAAIPAYPETATPRHHHAACRFERRHRAERVARPGKRAARRAAVPDAPKAAPAPPRDVEAAEAAKLGDLLGIPGGYADGIATPLPIVVRGRPYHFEGELAIGDRTYAFGTGGFGRGSIPWGDHIVTPADVGRWGARHGALGLDGGEMDDPQYPRRPREGIELHAAFGSLASAGCVAIRNFTDAKKAILAMIDQSGRVFLHIWPGIATVTPQRHMDRPVIVLNEGEPTDIAERHERHPRRYAEHRHRRWAHHHYASR
jgi:hypothetical protein